MYDSILDDILDDSFLINFPGFMSVLQPFHFCISLNTIWFPFFCFSILLGK